MSEDDMSVGEIPEATQSKPPEPPPKPPEPPPAPPPKPAEIDTKEKVDTKELDEAREEDKAGGASATPGKGAPGAVDSKDAAKDKKVENVDKPTEPDPKAKDTFDKKMAELNGGKTPDSKSDETEKSKDAKPDETPKDAKPGEKPKDTKAEDPKANDPQRQKLVDKINDNPKLKEAFDKMAPDQQKKMLDSIQDASKDKEQRNPSHNIEQNMLKALGDGKLGLTDKKGNTVMDNLRSMQENALKQEDHAKHRNKSEEFSGTLANIANPDKIGQGGYNYCAQTAVEQKFAVDKPGEYSRIMNDLSTNGKAQLADGSVLKATIDQNNMGDGNRANTLFQQSLTDNIDPSFAEYVMGGTREGLTSSQTISALDKLYGTEHDSTGNISTGPFESPKSTMDNMKKELDSGRSVIVGTKDTDPVTGGTVPHQVVVTGIQDGQISYIDSNKGGSKTVPVEDFSRIYEYFHKK